MQYNGAYDALIAECDQSMKVALKARLSQLKIKGNLASFPVTEPLDDGLFELRARSGKVRIRVLFGFLPGKRIVIVWGGTKDQRRLRPETIRMARDRLVFAAAAGELDEITARH